jgi:arylsulfatase A-like enzyme
MQNAVFEPLFTMDRKKDAATVNREFLDWLTTTKQPGRPFFVFLNYFDAHSPYVLPEGAEYSFGLKPQGLADFSLLVEHWTKVDRTKLSPYYRTLARDCYDNCLLYVDGQLNSLLQELRRRGILDQTLLVITSDHGEGLGEHDLFDHGESLYSTEIHVPLLIAAPGNVHPQVVNEPKSLRDLPATVAGLAGLAAASPFPGRSLATSDMPSTTAARPIEHDEVFSELPSANPANPNYGRSPANRGPLVSLAHGDYVFIANQGDGTEELFHQRDDRRELTIRAGFGTLKPLLELFRRLIRAFQSNER